MGKIKISYDKEGNTLNVWFDDPEKEYICEETGEEVILVKDKVGKIIGFEKLNYSPTPETEPKDFEVETTLV